MFGNIKKLHTKLYLGFFVIPALILVGISAYSIYSFLRIDRQVGTIYDDRVIPLRQLDLIADNYAIEIVDAVNKANANLITLNQAIAQVDTAQKESEKAWEAYQETYLTDREQTLVNELEELLAAANVEIQQLERVLEAGNRAGLSQFDGPLYKVIDPVTAKLRELMDLQLEVAQEERQIANRVLRETVVIFIILVVIAVFAASPFGYVVSNAIARQLRETVNQLSSSSTEIAAAAEEQERIAAHQASASNECSSTMDELNASAKSTAEQADAALNSAKHVLTLVDSYSATAQDSPGTPSRGLSPTTTPGLKEKVDQIAQQITSLSQQVEQIDKIATVVSSLANQTNMLALNAAVEAVRAGEQGKGFGVVASEIRKLADRSQESAERINHLVADIQEVTRRTVMVTDEGQKTVGTIVEAINEIVINSQQISLTAGQQAIAVQQVVEAMKSLNAGAQETATGIAQTKTSTQTLNHLARDLGTMV
ncbi:HAMP domain-containing methyl-accepting chemotaxis protein [Phormidium sp. CCY1219]|uniref:HAMP domain-containing methyl-accepting chemotaxis protein n=1 Tax=Phormidium sp. CCY1219 TaxID=2886104 RepID=UPI002D1ED04F|nr:methyl-accepting chemotaxis protein [Phormidium sp. CCY1219]MEB3827076.1 methyl-accepting chemotaxis protein [Phormidium sp. CCY1219]